MKNNKVMYGMSHKHLMLNLTNVLFFLKKVNLTLKYSPISKRIKLLLFEKRNSFLLTIEYNMCWFDSHVSRPHLTLVIGK